MTAINRMEDATQELVAWAASVQQNAESPFEAARQIVRRLGAHARAGRAEIGFWAPELAGKNTEFYLEVLTPLENIDFAVSQQRVRFNRDRLDLVQQGDYLWGVFEGMRAGSRKQTGAFYWVVYRDDDGQRRTIPDYLAYSIPFGVFAPAEFYDMEALQNRRADRDHFARLDSAPDPDGVPRVQAPANILQLHPGTASEKGTLAGLTRIYREIARKIRAGEALTPAEQNYTGYDAVQLMPIEPVIEFEDGPRFWEADSPTAGQPMVTVRRPNMTNWGYDVMICASPAPNPAVLGTGRPDELVDFIAALHDFPGQPIKAMFDIVYGHIDNQALPLMNEQFFAGANMYGQNLDFLNPVVRAILPEMQRRKHNYGVDGIRVDGAQDFKNWDPETDSMWHDDDYLEIMNNVEQDVAGNTYRPWMIFEDGRPWPRDDWELASTYREVTKRMPNVFQWGPLTFAHNTPFLFTFWIMKWWRIEEMTRVGSRWITGCANHDTLRRGTQVATDARINTYLGASLPEIFRNAYDNPAAKLFDYGFMPGVPMDFINASMRAPWSFIRNTDARYSVKVVSEEARFLDWAVTPERYADDHMFRRLKGLGFKHLDGLHRFLHTLDHVVQATDYDLPAMVRLMQAMQPPLAGPPLSVDALKSFARAWMDDVHDYCNVAHYQDAVEPQRARYNLDVREFRRARRWLMDDLQPGDHFDFQRPSDGSVLFYGMRRAPDGSESVLFIANMEGAPCEVTPASLPIPDRPGTGWQVALATPGLDVTGFDQPVTLADSQALVMVRRS